MLSEYCSRLSVLEVAPNSSSILSYITILFQRHGESSLARRLYSISVNQEFLFHLKISIFGSQKFDVDDALLFENESIVRQSYEMVIDNTSSCFRGSRTYYLGGRSYFLSNVNDGHIEIKNLYMPSKTRY